MYMNWCMLGIAGSLLIMSLTPITMMGDELTPVDMRYLCAVWEWGWAVLPHTYSAMREVSFALLKWGKFPL